MWKELGGYGVLRLWGAESHKEWPVGDGAVSPAPQRLHFRVNPLPLPNDVCTHVVLGASCYPGKRAPEPVFKPPGLLFVHCLSEQWLFFVC